MISLFPASDLRLRKGISPIDTKTTFSCGFLFVCFFLTLPPQAVGDEEDL